MLKNWFIFLNKSFISVIVITKGIENSCSFLVLKFNAYEPLDIKLTSVLFLNSEIRSFL